MKRFFVLMGIMLAAGVLLQAYQVGGTAKSSFGNPQAPAQGTNTTSEQGTTAPVVRSFTSYSSRQNKNKNGQAKPGQSTETVSQETGFMPPSVPVQSGKIAAVAADAKEKNTSAATPSASSASAAGNAAAGAAGMAQANAAMQQIQGMQSMVKNMSTMGGSAPAGGGAGQNGTNAAAQQLQGVQSMMQNMSNMIGAGTSSDGKSK